ncbi:MAG TPA: DegV family protein [Acidimicrobiales bacterium]|nr:DegV family protein [Acidimicrobiales bacterium]
MARVAVVTDSSTCLPAEILDKLGIITVPVTVHLPGADGVDGSDQLSHRISQAVARDQYVRSTQPYITDYLAAIEDSGCEDVVIVTPAMEFAAMFRNASLAAELTSRHAAVVDSRTAAAGEALVVLAGAEAAAAGASLAEVVETIESASRRVDLVATLATLDPIRRSHRVPAPLLRGSALHGVRSLFRMRDGTVELLGEVSGEEEGFARIREEYERGQGRDSERSTVFHADSPEAAERLSALLGEVDFVSGFSAAMQLHTGPGVIGAAWLPRPSHPGP